MRMISQDFTQSDKGYFDVEQLYVHDGKHYLGKGNSRTLEGAMNKVELDMNTFAGGDSTGFKAGRMREISGDELDSYLNPKQAPQRRGATSGEEESMENRIMDSWGKKLGSQIGKLFGK